MTQLSCCTITELESVQTVVSPRGKVLHMHCRQSYGLSFCVNGKIIYHHQGKEYVSDRNHAVILPKNAEYTLYCSEAGNFPLVNFQCRNLDLDTFLVIPLRSPEGYLQDFSGMQSNFLLHNARLKAFGILYELLHRLSGEVISIHPVLEPAIAYLEQGFADPNISNGQLAEKCGISEVYFRRLFKDYIGNSPRQYILELRIRKAKQLLANSPLPVAVIGEQCGFPNPYHFTRAVRTHTGLPPTEYRSQNQRFLL